MLLKVIGWCDGIEGVSAPLIRKKSSYMPDLAVYIYLLLIYIM